MKSVALKAYAKVNFGLAVIGRRKDGFHELRTIYQTISLADHLDVVLSSGPPRVHLEVVGLKVPEGRENLAVRSAEAVLRELRLKQKISIRLQKRIPSGSGLGGASSDAAAVIRAILHLTGKKLPLDRLVHIAASLGSDVPFFLWGGRALGVGRGEEVYPLPEQPRRWCVIIFPGMHISTAEAYRQLRSPRLTGIRTGHKIELFCGMTNQGGSERFGNDFEPVVFSAIPHLIEVKRSLLRSEAEMASVSGSGSSVFGIFRDHPSARMAVRQLRTPGHDVFLAHTVSRKEFQAEFPGHAGYRL